MQAFVKNAKANLRLVLEVYFFGVRNYEGSILDPAYPSAYPLVKTPPIFLM